MLQEEPVFSCQNDEWGNALSCDVDAYGVKENYRSYFHLDEDNYSCKTYYVDENSGEYNGDWVDIGDLAETLRAYASDDAPAVAQSETEILGDFGILWGCLPNQYEQWSHRCIFRCSKQR